MRKIIDFHQHFVLEPEVVKGVMDKHGIEKVVMMPLNFGVMTWEDVINEAGMNKKSKEYKENVLHDLRTVNIALSRKIRDEKRFEFAPWESASMSVELSALSLEIAMMAAFIPPADDVNEWYYYNIIARIEKLLQPIILIHTGWGTTIEPMIKVFDEFPDKTFVMKHMKEDDDSMNEIRKYVLKTRKNVYVETSYCPHPKRIEQYVKMGFGDRILFGSDFRTLEDESTLEHFINLIELARIPDDVKDDIFYNNAAELLDSDR
jgi:hypothetical protein